jgi:hypothetical protein
MPTIPIRSLGKIGVITDVNAVDLPPEAVSDARNVRFANGNITNSHVWREAIASPSGGTPVFLFSGERTNSADVLGYVTKDGRVYHVTNGTADDVSIAAYTPADSNAQRSFCALQGVYYVNQEDRVPWFYKSTSTDYATLTNWDANHRCRVLRSFKDFLVALNITKSGTAYQNMVKWSNIAQYDAVPDSWDPADLTKSAGENTLGELQTEILDGLTLRNSFIIYAPNQAYTMEYTAGPDVFQFFKLFGDRGIIGTNCVVEVDGNHFVFDDDDIYINDGVSPPKSICDKRVRKNIFRNIDLTKSESFFVYHEKAASEVWFCFNSKNAGLKWLGTDCTYCNYAAVYNYSEDTWTFHDLPNLTGLTYVSWQIGRTYDGSTAFTYDALGSSYADMVSNNTKNTFGGSVLSSAASIATTRIVNVDSGIGTALPFNSVSELAVVPYTERTGLDLDEVVPELKAYKNYRSIYPQVTVEDVSAPFNFKFGGVDNPQQDIEWDTIQSFEPTTDYKIDTRSRGRYLSWYFEGDNNNSYSLSGFDLDIVSVSRR